MIYFLIVWSVLGGICWLTGIALLHLVAGKRLPQAGDRTIAALWLGLITLANLLLAVSLGSALSPLVGWGVLLGAAGLSWLSPATRQELRSLKQACTPIRLVVGLAIAVAVAAFTTRQVTWIDTGLYHYAMIQWLREFGSVQGIALLSAPLGYVSSWFALAAPLNPPLLDGQVTAVTNGFTLLLVIVQTWIGVHQGLSSRSKLSDWFLVVFSVLTLPSIVFTRLLSVVLISPSPDIPLIFLIGLIAWSLLLTISSHRSAVASSPALTPDLLPFVLAIGALSIKVIALPLLPVTACFYLFNQAVRPIRLLVGSAIAALYLLPLIATQILTSGCVLYPSSALCFNLPWTKPTADVEQMAAATRGWGSWFGSPPPGVNPSLWFLQQWFGSIGSSKIIVLLVLLSLLSMGFVVWNAMRSPQPKPQVDDSTSDSWHVPSPHSLHAGVTDLLWLSALALLGTGFILLQAPLFRFGLGYVVVLPVLAIAMVLQTQIHQRHKWLQSIRGRSLWANRSWQRGLPLAGLALVTMMVVNPAVRSQLLLPDAIPSTQAVQRQINDVTYWQPQNKKQACWSTPLPCAASPDEGIHLNNPRLGLKAGFVRRDPSS